MVGVVGVVGVVVLKVFEHGNVSSTQTPVVQSNQMKENNERGEEEGSQ